LTWVLVFIVLSYGEVNAEYISTHDTMMDCFKHRELLASQTGGEYPGHYAKGMQGICIHTELVHAE
jgi:hypothetical protein